MAESDTFESASDLLVSGERRSIAILFCDLVGSTKLYQERGDAFARQLVGQLHELFLSELKSFSGRMVKNIGDGFMVTFSRPKQALACAISVQRRLEEYNKQAPPADRMQVRIGVHHDKAIVEDGDVYGDAVNTAARIQQKAGPEEIWASLATWRAAGGLDTEIVRLGEAKLKGLSQALALVRVLWQAADIEAERKRLLEQELLPELVEAIAAKRCVLVLGGLTLGPRQGAISGRVAQVLAKELGMAERRGNMFLLGSLFEEAKGREELSRVSVASLGKERDRRPEILRALAKIPFDLVLTTDQDQRMQRALAAAGRSVLLMPHLAQANPARAEDGQLGLVKVYGDVSDPDSLVLTEEEAAVRLDGLRLVPDELQGKLAVALLLFVGFRWSDSSFRRLYRQLTAHVPSGQQRCVGLSGKVAPGVKSTWRRRGLRLAAANETEFAGSLVTALEKKRQASAAAGKESDKLGDSSSGNQWKRPYKFLSSFQEEDVEIFFGREEETAKVFSQVVSHRLVVLHGPSGAGKTSLLNAGLFPRLRQEGFAIVVRRALKDPEGEIRQGVGELLRKHSKERKTEEDFTSSTAVNILTASLGEFLKESTQVLAQPLVLVLDQFEEFFLRFPKKVRQSFAESLGTVIRQRGLNVRFVLSMRHDFLAHLSEMKNRVPEVFHHDFFLPSMSPEGMAQAIEGPAELAGLSFEKGLVAKILSDLGTVGSEPPQLQIICDRLYDVLAEDERKFTLKHYQQLGEVRGILGSYLERFIETRAPGAKSLGRRVLKALVTSVGTKGVVDANTVVQETGDNLRVVTRMLEQLIQARLVRKLVADGEESYELSHEYLIDEIEHWIEEKDRDLKKARELLRQEVINHEKFGLLMAHSRILIVRQHEQELSLSKNEKDLITKSLRHHRSKRRWTVAALLLSVTLAITGSIVGVRHLRGNLCAGAQEKLAGVWDATVQRKMSQAFVGTGRTYAQSSYDRVAALFDTYSDQWQAMRTEACEATHLRGEQSEQLLDLRMACLDRHLSAFQAMTTVLSDQVDGKVIDRAVSAAHGLRSLQRCADAEALKSVVPMPEDAETQRRIKQLSGKVYRAKALEIAGKHKQGLAEMKELVAEARSLAYPPVLAEALHYQGWFQSITGNAEGGEVLMSEALRLAALARDTELMTLIMSHRIFVLGFRLARYPEARQLGQVAQAMVELAGSGAIVRGNLLANIAVALWSEGDYLAAKSHLEKALAIYEAAGIRDVPSVASALTNLGNNLAKLGESELSGKQYQRALAISEKALGSHHPDVARDLCNLGANLSGQKKYDQALSHLRRAQKIFENAFAPDHLYVATVANNIGEIFNGKQEYPKAIPYCERALAIGRKNLTAMHPVHAYHQICLARAFLGLGRDQEAVKLLEAAVKIREQKGSSLSDRVAVRHLLAKALWAAGQDRVRARQEARKALAMVDKSTEKGKASWEEINRWLNSTKQNKK